MTKFRIASVQLNLIQSVSSIVKDIRRYIKTAKKKGVDIVCFPECSIDAGPKRNAQVISKIRQDCKENKIWCITGGHLRARKHVYNTSMLINNKGKISGLYRKVHLCDSPHIHAGTSFKIYNTPFCKIGIAICWDVSFPTAIYSMAKKGAKLVFCPMYWAYEEWEHKREHKKLEKKVLQSLILTRAYENLIYVVFSNAYDPEDKTVVSYSAIAEPNSIIKEIFDREGMIIADIDLDHLRKLRKNYHKEYNKRI